MRVAFLQAVISGEGRGLFEVADIVPIFLDEIGDIPPEQGKGLLYVSFRNESSLRWETRHRGELMLASSPRPISI